MDGQVRPSASEVAVRVFGLPVSSFITLIVIPALIVGYQFFYCWQLYTGRRD